MASKAIAATLKISQRSFSHRLFVTMPMTIPNTAIKSPYSEPFSSCDPASLKNVDGFGQLPGAPGAAAELAQDVPGLELGVGALAGRSQLRVGAVGLFLRGWLVRAPVGSEDRVA